MNLLGATQCRWAGFRQAYMADQSSVNELSHRANGLFDRRRRVDAVQVIEVDVIGAQAPQACIERRPHTVGTAQTAERPIRVEAAAELGRDDHLVAPALDGSAYQP